MRHKAFRNGAFSVFLCWLLVIIGYYWLLLLIVALAIFDRWFSPFMDFPRLDSFK